MSLILVIASFICLLVATCIAGGWLIESDNWPAWLSFGLALYVASHLVGPAGPWRRTPQ